MIMDSLIKQHAMKSSRHDCLSWACLSMGLWILAAGFDLFAQWRLLSPPWRSFFGNSTVSLLIIAYGICGMIAGILIRRLVRRVPLKWILLLGIPSYISFCALFLGQAAHASFRGLVILGASVGIAALAGYGLRNTRPSPIAGLLILIAVVPLGLRTGYTDESVTTPSDADHGTSNLILVTIDTLRPDRLGSRDYERRITPGLD